MASTNVLLFGAKSEVDTRAGHFITGVYQQMMAGVLLTALVAYALVLTGVMMDIAISGGRAVILGIFILQFGTITMFRPMAQSQSAGKLKALFFFYAAITGVTVGYVALAYTLASIMNVFLCASFAFAGLALFGHITKRNLGVVGTFCLQALWMLIGMSILQFIGSFFPSFGVLMPALNMTSGLLGIVVFSGLTAYESQLIRATAYRIAESPLDETRVSIYTTSSALTMYLNFINLFFSLLRVFGRRR